MGEVKPPPRWIVSLNIAALRLGLKVGSQHLLSIPGRRSGKPRSTPVSIVAVGGLRYVVAAFSEVDWVKNARAAGEGVLARGRTRERVRIVELPIEERPAVLVEFLRQVPGGVRFFGLSSDPKVIVTQADRYPVFRLDLLA
jgi:deazaflavin-dependent oxidoreductase (nitroreductase family)